IPNNVTTIKYECFASNKISILSIKEPSQILSIEKDAFNYYLDSITLPLHKNPKFSAYQLGSNILLENETVAYNRSVFKTILDRGYVLSYYHWSNSPSRYYTMRHFMEQDSVFVISDKGYANKTDYRFIGWNTEKDGSGKHYNVGDSLAMPAHNFSLYAHWMPNVKVTIKGYSPDCASKDNGYLELTSTAQQNITGFIIEKGTSFIIKPNEALVISNLASGTYNIIINIDDEILSEHKIIIPTIPELKSSVLVNGTKATFTIKGGTVPYQIVINGTSYKTETGYLETNKLKAGIYTAIINDANLCSESNILTFSVNNLICYPNPVTNGILNIILPRDPEDATYQAIIYSLKSEIIFTEVLNLESSNTTIDVSSLVEGSYLLNVVNNTGYNETVKFILNK
ncbi:MAG TPA: T9SS type A sorting domain-containing protein, partial [Epulopiscium sp.]|nr:T9SS type A sorting domain-containing protein [Candidatus Epulonipiscium sp.]